MLKGCGPYLRDGGPLAELLYCISEVRVCQDIPAAILYSYTIMILYVICVVLAAALTHCKASHSLSATKDGGSSLYASSILHAALLKPHCGASGTPCMTEAVEQTCLQQTRHEVSA